MAGQLVSLRLRYRDARRTCRRRPALRSIAPITLETREAVQAARHQLNQAAGPDRLAMAQVVLAERVHCEAVRAEFGQTAVPAALLVIDLTDWVDTSSRPNDRSCWAGRPDLLGGALGLRR